MLFVEGGRVWGGVGECGVGWASVGVVGGWASGHPGSVRPFRSGSVRPGLGLHIVRVYLRIVRVLPTHHVRKNVVGGIEGPEPTST